MAIKDLLSIRSLLEVCGSTKFQRGMLYHLNRQVIEFKFESARRAAAMVKGNEVYTVEITAGRDGASFLCGCPSFEKDKICKHCAAAGLAAIEGREYTTIPKKYTKRILDAVSKTEEKYGMNPGGVYSFGKGSRSIGNRRPPRGMQHIQAEKGLIIWGINNAPKILDCFDELDITPGLTLDGYFNFDFMGGNFLPIVRKSSKPLPPWTDTNATPFFQPEKCPRGADPGIDRHIVVSGSPESYFQKAIFMESIFRHGAFWHGLQSWSPDGILDDSREAMPYIKDYTVIPGRRIDHSIIPQVMSPRVYSARRAKTVTVEFFYFSHGLGGTIGIFAQSRKLDLHGVTLDISTRCIVDLGEGPTP